MFSPVTSSIEIIGGRAFEDALLTDLLARSRTEPYSLLVMSSDFHFSHRSQSVASLTCSSYFARSARSSSLRPMPVKRARDWRHRSKPAGTSFGVDCDELPASAELPASVADMVLEVVDKRQRDANFPVFPPPPSQNGRAELYSDL